MPENSLPGSHKARASHSSIHRRERRQRKRLCALQHRAYIEELEQKLISANEEILQMHHKVKIMGAFLERVGQQVMGEVENSPKRMR